jgi:DNA-binding transcriptional LysR family regulator
MDIRRLRQFLVVAEELNFSRAAARLHISQPALSQLVQSLESELDGALFERHPRGVTLSQAGLVFKDEAFDLVARFDQALARTRRVAHGDAGRLHVGFNELSGQHRIFAEAVRRFRVDHPDVALEIMPLTAHEQIGLLRSGSIDAGFQYWHQEEAPDFVTHLPLEADHYVLALARSHPLAARDRIDPAALSRTTLIRVMRIANPPLHDRISRHLSSLGIAPAEILETGSDVATLNLVAAGLGAGVVQARHRSSARNIVFRDLPGAKLVTHLVMAWRSDRRTAQLDKFIRRVRAVARTMKSSAGDESPGAGGRPRNGASRDPGRRRPPRTSAGPRDA